MWNKRAWTLSRRAKRTTPNQKTRRKRRRARSRPRRSIHRAPQMPSHLKSAWPSWRHWSGPRAARTCSPTRPTRSIWLARPIASSSSWRRCTTYSMSWSAPRMPRDERYKILIVKQWIKTRRSCFFEKLYFLNVSIFADIIFNSEKITNLKRQIKCAYLKKNWQIIFE